MRAFLTREFRKAARRFRIEDANLMAVVADISAGLVDAWLGSEVIKQRVARAGAGKSGGYRVLLAFRIEHRCVFVDVFAKNEEANISEADLKDLRRAAKMVLSLDDDAIKGLLADGHWLELELEG